MAKHKHADLLIAYANDTTLRFERQHSDGYWFDAAPSPAFDPAVNYRIKPEPKKAFVFMHKKGSSRWFSSSYDTMLQTLEHREHKVRFGYDVTDIKEVEFV